jgi:alkylation response protein AidB-like acyl-CoA dehydrogenase
MDGRAKVELDLTDGQQLLVDTSTRFAETAFPLTAVRDRAGAGAEPGGAYTTQAGELGWFAMFVPEELGGGAVSDNPFADGALVGAVRGRGLQPGSFVGTNVVAYALARGGSPDQQAKVLPQLISGAETATWAYSATGTDSAPTAGVTAVQKGGAWVLSGAKTLVQDAGTATWTLVTASADGDPVQFLIPTGASGVAVESTEGLDLSRRFGRLVLDGAELPASALVGPAGMTRQLVEGQVDLAAVLTAAESVGAMEHDFAMALQYAKDRTAFGRPIGSFQAVKHLLANTSLLLEMSRAMVSAAVRALDDGAADASATASMTKAFVADAGVELAQNCFQVFGGIGFTWEHDQHLYLRRLTTDAILYGDATWHRERLCVLGGL